MLINTLDSKCAEANDAEQLVQGSITVPQDIEHDLGAIAKKIVQGHTITCTQEVAALKEIKDKWLPTKSSSKADTIIKALLRAICSRKIKLTEEDIGIKIE